MNTRLPMHLRAVLLLYALVAAWSGLMLLRAGDDAAVLMPSAVALAASPLIALGLWKVKRPAWFALMLQLSFFTVFALVTIPFCKDPTVLAAPFLHLAASALAFIPRNARAPFLNPERRGFRQTKRWDINLRTVLNDETGSREAETLDLSQRGAYIAVHTKALTVDQKLMVELQLRGGEAFRLPARIMSVNPEGLGTKPEGIGVSWGALTESDTSRIERFIEEGRRHSRTPVQIDVAVKHGGKLLHCRSYDVSESGCYLQLSDASLHPGDSVALSLSLYDGDKLDLVGVVTWLPDQERAGKPDGIAVEFASLSKTDIARLKQRIDESV